MALASSGPVSYLHVGDKVIKYHIERLNKLFRYSYDIYHHKICFLPITWQYDIDIETRKQAVTEERNL